MRRWLRQNFTALAGHVFVQPGLTLGLGFQQVPITDGVTIEITISGNTFIPTSPFNPAVTQNISVRVEVTESGWIFHTGEDHFADGTIAFSLLDAGDGNIQFAVNIDARLRSTVLGDTLTRAGFDMFAHPFERATWTRLTDRVREKCQE